MGIQTRFFAFIITGIIIILSGCNADRQKAFGQERGDVSHYDKYLSEALPDSLLTEIKAIWTEAGGRQDIETLSKANTILTNYYIMHADYEKAFACLTDYLSEVEAYGDSTHLIQAYFSTGRSYFGLGLSWIALTYFQRMSELNLSESQRAFALYAIGEALRDTKTPVNKQKAAEYYRMSETIARKNELNDRIADCLFGQSQLLYPSLETYKRIDLPLTPGELDSLHQANELLQEAITLSSDTDILYAALGLNYARLKDFSQAQHYIDKGYEQDISIPDFVPIWSNVKAVLYLCMDDYSRAMDYCDQAYTAAEAYNKKGDMRNTVEIIYYIRKKQDNVALALDAHERFCILRDQLSDQTQAMQTIYSQVALDTKIKEEQLLLSEEKNKRYVTINVITGAFALLLILLMTYIWVLYRRIHKAYRTLTLRNQQWAETIITDEYTQEYRREQELLQRLDEFLLYSKRYTDPKLTIGMIADELDTNRTYLSDAINKISKKNFNQYVNEYRIKEAIRVMSNPENDKLTLDAIALRVGFNSRSTFYRSFHEITGLTPTLFRQNRSQSSL